MSALQIRQFSKEFGSHRAVCNIDLDVAEGSVVALLGPSGCGKTTTLRCIAGLEEPSSGRISIGDTVVFDSDSGISRPPERRGVGLVFQSYALWPHLTVAGNVGYGLKIKRLPAREVKNRVDAILKAVELEDMSARYPSTLSGGQQQRVALARSLVMEPNVLLFDEPLSNLDSKLRETMRRDLRQMIKHIGLTSIYVTHDQAEAMVVADWIVLMNEGRIVQQGPAQEMYERPATRFAAEFLGSANVLEGIARLDGDTSRFVLALPDGTELIVDAEQAGLVPAGPCQVAIRPEKVGLFSDRPRMQNVLPGIVSEVVYLGSLTMYEVNCQAGTFAVQGDSPMYKEEDHVWLGLPPADLCPIGH